MLEKSLVERAGGGLSDRGVDGSSSLGCEGVKKRRSLEGKVYFYDRGIWALFLGMNPLEEGVEESGEGTASSEEEDSLSSTPRNMNYS